MLSKFVFKSQINQNFLFSLNEKGDYLDEGGGAV